jgi:hypothetical protein
MMRLSIFFFFSKIENQLIQGCSFCLRSFAYIKSRTDIPAAENPNRGQMWRTKKKEASALHYKQPTNPCSASLPQWAGHGSYSAIQY